MERIMALFEVTLISYETDAATNGFSAEFYGEQYPPRIVLTENTPPLYIRAADGTEREETQPTITIIGSVDGEVAVCGKCKLTKKALNGLVNKGLQLVELYLHGYMQEQSLLGME